MRFLEINWCKKCYANAGSWNIIEQFYIFNLATTTGQRLTMAATLKYLNGTYVSDADPIEKIYGIK